MDGKAGADGCDAESDGEGVWSDTSMTNEKIVNLLDCLRKKQIFLFVYRFFDKKMLEDTWRILYNFL